MFQQNKPLFTVLEDIFPLEPVRQNNYGQMGYYNSNRVIPSYDAAVPPVQAQQYLNRVEHEYPDAKIVNGMYLPRSTSYAAVSQQQTSPLVQYSQFTVPPGFAGGLPYMKNALREDKNIVMNPYGDVTAPVLASPELQQPLSVYPYHPQSNNMDWKNLGYYTNNNIKSDLSQPEGFRFTNPTTSSQSELSCDEIRSHIFNCSMCQKFYSYERKLWITIIIMIIVVFLTIIYLLERRKI